MRLLLDYGSDGLEVELPDERVTVIEPVFRPAVAEPHVALREAIRSPIECAPLGELVRQGQRVAISVCDVTRAQPRREMLLALFDELPQVRAEDVTILIATGTHRANTPAELERMLGRDILDRYRVINHDARDAASLAYVGRTATGVAVHLNREFLNADIRITTGFVEPHFFAGFSGGPKMVAPGLAGLETVMTLHDAKRIGHPNATWGITEGNPIHDDVREIARMVGVHFAIDVTLNREQQITAVFAGDLFAEHRAACAYAKEKAMREVPAPFDVVLTSNAGYPLDQNLYQAVKGMSAAAQDRQAGRHDRLRGRVPRRPAVARVVRRRPRVAADADGAARDDQRAGVCDAGSMAGADSGADSAARGCAREDRGSDARRAARRAPHADRRRVRRRSGRAATVRPRGDAMRIAAGASDHSVRSVLLLTRA